MAIPQFKDWMDRTKRGVFTPRSPELQALDKALEKFDKDKSLINKQRLKEQLDAWIKAKGSNWRASTRNKDKVVEELYNAFYSTKLWTAPPLPLTPLTTEIYLGQSFEHSNSLARAEVPKAFKRAKQLIEVTFRKLNVARSPGPDRAIYEKWFGTYDATRFNKVLGNVRKIYDTLFLKAVLLYYRGPGVTGSTDCLAETGTLKPENFFGAAWKPENLPSTLNNKYTHLFLGSAFFTSGVYAQDSISGVIIHELSHAICATDDVVYNGKTTYGPKLCKALATGDPAKAVNNADSYEYLAENYQNALFVPTEKTLNLPPKASITLNLTR